MLNSVVSVVVFTVLQNDKYNRVNEKIYLRKAEEAYFYDGLEEPKYAT